jgi:hypothetical protein
MQKNLEYNGNKGGLLTPDIPPDIGLRG